jgi:hypothetical protein
MGIIGGLPMLLIAPRDAAPLPHPRPVRRVPSAARGPPPGRLRIIAPGEVPLA